MYRLAGFGSSQVDPIFFFLDFDQVELIQYFFYWIWIKSSWSNFYFFGFWLSRVDPIFFVVDLNQVELIQFLFFGFFSSGAIFFRCTRIRYFFVGSSPAALWRPCASLISALTKLNLAPRTNFSLSLPTLLNIKEKMKTTVSEPADAQRHFLTCRKKNSKIHDSYVRKMVLPSFFIIFSGLFNKIHNIRIDLGGESKDLCFFRFFIKNNVLIFFCNCKRPKREMCQRSPRFTL